MDNLRLLENFLDDKKNIVALRRFCQRYTRNTEVAKEIAQDALCKMFVNIEKYDEKRASIKTIIFWFAKNLALNHIRDNPNPDLFVELNQDITRQFIHIDNPLDNVMDNERSELLTSMVSSLPPKMQAAVKDFYIDDNDRTHRAPSFYVRLQNGRDRIREKMKENDYDGFR